MPHRPVGTPAPRRIAAWLVTGPLGHLAAGIADWVALLASAARARYRS